MGKAARVLPAPRASIAVANTTNTRKNVITISTTIAWSGVIDEFTAGGAGRGPGENTPGESHPPKSHARAARARRARSGDGPCAHDDEGERAESFAKNFLPPTRLHGLAPPRRDCGCDTYVFLSKRWNYSLDAPRRYAMS